MTVLIDKNYLETLASVAFITSLLFQLYLTNMTDLCNAAEIILNYF